MNDWDLLQKLKLYALAKHDDMGVFFIIENRSHGLSYSLPGYFRPI